MSAYQGRPQGDGARGQRDEGRHGLARLAPMKWRLVGVALGLAFYAALWLLVVAGASALAAPLITLPVIVLLVAGGNWLQHWLGITRAPPRFATPVRDDDEDAEAP